MRYDKYMLGCVFVSHMLCIPVIFYNNNNNSV